MPARWSARRWVCTRPASGPSTRSADSVASDSGCPALSGYFFVLNQVVAGLFPAFLLSPAGAAATMSRHFASSPSRREQCRGGVWTCPLIARIEEFFDEQRGSR